MASILIEPIWSATDGNGKKYPGAKLYVYEAGTTDDVIVFSDNALTIPHSQPIVADANGDFPIIYSNSDVYKFVLRTAGEALIKTYDNIASMIAGDGGTLPVASGGTGSQSPSTARGALGAASQSDYDALNTVVGDINSEMAGIGGSLGDMAAKDSVSVDDLESGQNPIIKRAFYTSQEITVMNITDGTEYESQSFTPIRNDSIVSIKVNGVANTGSTSVNVNIGIFRTGTTNALEAMRIRPNARASFSVSADFSPGAITAQTFSIRATGTLEDLQLEIVEHFVT